MGIRRATGMRKTRRAARPRSAEARPGSASSDVAELLHRAWAYDDKPHQLYSHILAMADRHEPDPVVRAEIRRLMDRQYLRASSGVACLEMDAARRDPASPVGRSPAETRKGPRIRPNQQRRASR